MQMHRTARHRFQLATDRMVARPYEEKDWDAYVQRVRDRNFMAISGRTPEELAQVELHEKIAQTRDEKIFWYGVFPADRPDVLSGEINFAVLDYPLWDVSYFIMEKFRGRKVMSEVLPPMLAEFSRVMNVSAYQAMVNQKNAPSLRLLDRNGFRHDGQQADTYGWMYYQKRLKGPAADHSF